MLRLDREEKRTLGSLLILTGLFFGVLQVWQPYFFLNDDNLSYLSFVVQLGQRLGAGEYPYFHEAIYGGYDWRQDSAFLHLTHPVVALVSLLVLTPGQAQVMEVLALINLVTASVAFYFLARLVRQRWQPELSGVAIIFLSLSYTFCGYNLILGASWTMYMANLAALPLIVLGLLHPSSRWGLLWTTLGLANSVLLGHIGPVLYAGVFVTAFALLASRSLQSWRPLLHWMGGIALSLALTAVFWVPALVGFQASGRSLSIPLEFSLQGAYPFLQTFASTFLGSASQWLGLPVSEIFDLAPAYAASLACFAAAWLIPLALVPKANITTPALMLSRAAMLTVFLAALVITRPVWLGELFLHLPLFSSLRWPFKELFFVVFFLHLWLLLRPWRGGKGWQVALGTLGTCILVASLGSADGRAPAFSDRSEVRCWYLSGSAHRYWAELLPRLPADKLIVPVVAPSWTGSPWDAPHPLIATGNYAGLFPGVRSAYGHSPTIDESQLPYPPPANLSSNLALQGIFLTDLPESWLQAHPELVAVELVQREPLHIRLRFWDGSQLVRHLYTVSPNGELTPLGEAETN